MEKTTRNKIGVALIAVTALAGVLIPFWRDGEKLPQNEYPQEFRDLQVVQFYLHMSGRDYIISRESSSFNKVMKAARAAVLSVNKPFPEGGVKSIDDIERSSVSLAIWMPKPQKISTRVKQDLLPVKDRYGNGVIVSDRLLLVLGGKFAGKLLARNSDTGQWQAWHMDSSGVQPLVELVRSGGL